MSTKLACLHEILEESSEEEGEKRTSQIQALVPVVITVIQLTASQRCQQQPAIVHTLVPVVITVIQLTAS